MLWRIALTVIASWLMAAHFLRAGDLILTALCLATPALFFIRRRWSIIVLQVLCFAGAIVWVDTAWRIVEMRRLFGQPWLRSAIIIGAVALFTALTGLLLRSRTLRDRYPTG